MQPVWERLLSHLATKPFPTGSSSLDYNYLHLQCHCVQYRSVRCKDAKGHIIARAKEERDEWSLLWDWGLGKYFFLFTPRGKQLALGWPHWKGLSIMKDYFYIYLLLASSSYKKKTLKIKNQQHGNSSPPLLMRVPVWKSESADIRKGSLSGRMRRFG